MTEAIALLGDGTGIRSLFSEGEPGWFPVVDLTKAWGLNRTTLFKHITRNPEDFADCSRLVDILSTDGANEQALCVNEVGLYQLLTRVTVKKLKNPLAKDAIMRFRKDLPVFVQKLRKKEIMHVPPSSAEPVLETELTQAKRIAELTGTDLKTMQAAALRKCGLKEYADALTPSLMHGQAGTWLNPTDIGNRCGHSAHEINNFLSFHRFQYRDQSGVWRLTDKGELHGEEYWFESSTRHREVRIRWRDSILTASGLIREPCETLAKV